MRASAPLLLLDNGDVNKGYGRQPELKFETAMKAMAHMGYAAANVGEQDLLLGLDYLKYVQDFANVPLVSANIVSQDGTPIFQPFVLHKVQAGQKEMTVGVVGLISASFKEEIETSNPEFVVEDYVPVVERIFAQIQDKADIVLVLAHMSEDEACMVAERFPQIHFIIASHSGDDPLMTAVVCDGVPIGFAGIDGKNLGIARFELSGGQVRLSEYATRKLDGTLEGSPAIVAMLQDYQYMVKAERLVESFPRIRHGEAQFAGKKSCQTCHQGSASLFSKDKHAHAFDALVGEGSDYDPECVRCHTVGFGYISGFMSPDATPELEHVGCENCHGPGSAHNAAPLEKGYGTVTEETCRSCHDLANSPNFVYEEYRRKLTPHGEPALSG